MKALLIIMLMPLFAMGQVQPKPKTTYTVKYCVRHLVQDPCPDAVKKDKFGRKSSNYGCCLVFHCHAELSCDSAIFTNRVEAFDFCNEAANDETGDIASVVIDSMSIPIKTKIGIGSKISDSVNTVGSQLIIRDSKNYIFGYPIPPDQKLTLNKICSPEIDTITSGQKTVVTHSQYDTIRNITIVTNSNKSGEGTLDNIFSQSLVRLYRQYKAECYNDSTLQTVYKDHNQITIHPGGGCSSTLMAPIPAKRWVHKTPTFEGFMEWIEKNNR